MTVDESIGKKLAMANTEFKRKTGADILVASSYRSTEQQAKLYEELSKKGARVAPPGKSFHEKGLAIDVMNWKEAEPILRKYGFANELADDKGHFSVGEFGAQMVRGEKQVSSADIFKGFATKVDASRKKGVSDTQILDYLAKQDQDFAQKLEQSRSKYGSSQFANNDRDLINWLAQKFDNGKKPSVPSVPDKNKVATDGDRAAIEGKMAANDPDKQKLIQETDNLFEKYAVNPTEKVANFFFGNLAKVIGSPFVDLAQVLTAEDKSKTAADIVTGKQKSAVGSITTTELGFAGLEAIYGEGMITGALSKIPGLKYVVSLLSKAKGAVYKSLRAKAVELMTQALKPTTNEMKAKTAKIVEEALDRGIKGTAKGIQETAQAGKTRAWNSLDEALQAIPKDKTQSTYPIIKELADRQRKYVVDGVVVDRNSYEAINQVGDLILQFGDEISSASLNRVRSMLDRMTYGAGKVFGKTLKEGTEVNAQKELADIIRGEFAKDNPDIAKLNSEYSFWSTLNEIITTTINRTKPQGGTETAATVIGAATGMATGGVGTALQAGLFAKYLTKVLRSTYWKSVSAANRNRVATMISEGKIEQAAYLLSRLYDGLQNTKK